MAEAATHGQAFTQTENTRYIMDKILNYMIKQLSVRDLLQMSNPSECKKYVLFKANSIYQYFYELRIFPTKDSKGILTFRKVDDLVNPKGEQEKEHQSLCLIVAYFYTRIFQIYGALALTLIDDMNAMTSSGIMSLPLGTDARLRTPGHYVQEFNQGVGGQSPYESVGGVGDFYNPVRDSRPEVARDTTYSLHHFKWIRSYLTSDYSSTLGFKTQFEGPSSNRGVVYLKLGNDVKNSTPRLQTRQDGTFYIGISGMNNNPATLEVYTRDSSLEGIEVHTKTLSFTNQYGEKITTDQFEKTFKVESQQVNGKTTYVLKKDKSNISEYLNQYFSEITQYLKDAIKVRKNASNSSRIAPSGRRSEEGIASHLRLEKIIEELTKHKPLGRCIARALELLKNDPFSKEPGMSHICSATFAENKRMGVVKPGAPLSDDPGLFALANLFYDTVTMGSPHLTIGEKEVDGTTSMQQYIAFMTKLAKQYTMDKGPRTADEYKKGLSSIVDSRDKELCSTTGDISLSRTTTAKVQEIVKSMFDAQVKHSSECFKIIKMLFNITYDKATGKPISIKLHDDLISKGFPELDRINRLARELLVNYYSNCEDKYREGMYHILLEKKAETNAAAKVAADTKAKANAEVQAKAQQNALAKKIAADAQFAKAAQEKEAQAAKQEARRAQQAEKQHVQEQYDAAKKARMEALTAKRAQEQQEKEQRNTQKKEELQRLIRQKMELNERAKEQAKKAAEAYQQAKALQQQKGPKAVPAT
jgi:hypothetical protein